jgi:hypothetical protein
LNNKYSFDWDINKWFDKRVKTKLYKFVNILVVHKMQDKRKTKI